MVEKKLLSRGERGCKNEEKEVVERVSFFLPFFNVIIKSNREMIFYFSPFPPSFSLSLPLNYSPGKIFIQAGENLCQFHKLFLLLLLISYSNS